MADTTKSFYAKSRQAWRKWLEKNHLKEKKVHLIKYKKHTGKPSLSHRESMEEAICFGWIEDVKNKKKVKVKEEPEEEDDEDNEDDEDKDNEEESDDDDETEEEIEPKSYKSEKQTQNNDFKERPAQTIRVMPYIFMVFGLTAFSFFVMSIVLIWIPYAIIPAAAYVIILVLSMLLAALSYWAITHATDSAHATAWGGLLVPILPLAAIMFLQRTFLALAQHRNEIQQSISRDIPALFAPLFDSVYPLPIVIALIFYICFTVPFLIFLFRKKAKAAWLFLTTPLIFAAMWFLLQPLINKVVIAWVTYFKSL